jgi:hypothetical protein
VIFLVRSEAELEQSWPQAVLAEKSEGRPVPAVRRPAAARPVRRASGKKKD